MDEVQTRWLFLLFIASVITLAVSLFLYYQNLRRRAFIEVAAKLGLQFSHLSYGLPKRLGLLYQLRRGSNRYAQNIMSGRTKGGQVFVFDYHYCTGDKFNKAHHHNSIVMLRHGLRVPEVRIYPPPFMEQLGRMAGYDKVEHQTGDEAFDKAFTVLASDPALAAEVLQPPMREYLLRHPAMSVEVGDEWIASCMEQPHIPEEIPRRIRQLQKIMRIFRHLESADPFRGMDDLSSF
ncbi:MAG: hypothetical protein H3C30_18140 [Candidatus Hydrogenedentes bacterium]|nr:hypothetical protein [Candidatus Hydrogenedentota bacterium]